MTPTDDIAIRALITAQFAALAWDEGGEADWAVFADGFLAGAPLFPAARPVNASTVTAFVDRMRGLAAAGTLRAFEEAPLAIHVQGYGNVAVALAGCEITENGDTITRDVSAFLLVRSDGHWRIAAQGWDAETPGNPLPPHLTQSTQG